MNRMHECGSMTSPFGLVDMRLHGDSGPRESIAAQLGSTSSGPKAGH